MTQFSKKITYCLVAAVFLLLATLFPAVGSADGPQYTTGTTKTHLPLCFRCNQPIHGGFVKAGGHRFHPSCFVCTYCQKPISGSYQEKDGNYYHADCYKKAMGLRCFKCGKLLQDRWQVLGDRKFHPQCLKDYLQETRLKCDLCGKPIKGKYTKDKTRNYHIDCYRKYKLHRCVVCSLPIEGKMIIDPWGNRAHQKHGKHQTTTCSSCSRIISRKTSKGGFRYSDGRTICGFCRETVVEQNNMVMHSRNTVLAALYTIGITNLPPDIPIHVVDLNHLRKMSGAAHPSNSKGYTHCLTQYQNGKAVSRKQSIYILTGLPQLEFNGVLAHEMIHAWLNQLDIKLSPQEMEGFCNLGAMKIYKNDGSRFAEVLLQNMEKDPAPLYGGGYRAMKKQLDRLGWPSLIKWITEQ